MSLTLKGLSATTMLKKADVIRITLGKAYSVLDDAFFATRVRDFWSAIDTTGKCYTISPNPAIKDGKPAVIDARISVNGIYASELSTILETLSGFYTDVVEIELLKPEDAKKSASNVGAEQREVTKKEAAEKADDGSLSGKIGAALGVAKHIVTIGLVAGAIVAVIVYAPQIKAVAKRVGVK